VPMSDEKRTSVTSDLQDLERRLEEVRNRHDKSQEPEDNSGSLLGMAWRMSTELVVAVLVGTALGYGLDRFLGTQPWLLLLGIGFGFAAGIMNVLRSAAKMDAANADVPIGDDMPDDDDLDAD